MSARTSDATINLPIPADEKHYFSIDEQTDAISSSRQVTIKPTTNAQEEFKENVKFLLNFDLDEAWSDLIYLPGTCQVILSESTQEEMGLKVGINVSSQFPWKQLKIQAVTDYLLDKIENTERLKEAIQTMGSEDQILFGYVPKLSKQHATFLIFETHEAAARASTIIEKIENYEHWLINKRIFEHNWKWKTKESEAEVNSGFPRIRQQVFNVEVQTTSPLNKIEGCKPRRCEDVRDGCVEVLPSKVEHVFRKCMNVAIQTAVTKFSKIDLTQQTDLSYFKNAWSQTEQSTESLEDSDVNAHKGGNILCSNISISPPTPEISNQFKTLTSALEINKLDILSTNDYHIAKYKLPKYTIPHMEEFFIIANMSKSHDRYVCSVDWYPGKTGTFAASYTFSAKATTVPDSDTTDVVKRTMLEPNPVLLWSFADTTNNNLEFSSPREITCLSFCPYDENILIGGTINGQIIIWDLQNIMSNLTEEDKDTLAKIKVLMSWTKVINTKTLVRLTAASALKTSQTGTITSIKWLHRNHYITTAGHARENSKELHKYFVTMSTDGSIAFWNLDVSTDQTKTLNEQKQQRRKLPTQFIQKISKYKQHDRTLKPTCVIKQPYPIAAAEFDDTECEFTPVITRHTQKSLHLTDEIAVRVSEKKRNLFRQKFIYGTMTGSLHSISWKNTDEAKAHEFPQIHDGPVVAVVKNPYLHEIFVSVGRKVFAIWSEDYIQSPILWRKRPADISSAKWSADRPALLFLARGDGKLEAWDFLYRTDEPYMIDQLGAGFITSVIENRFALPKKLIGIADYNSVLRMFVLPDYFQVPLPNEQERLKVYIEREITRLTELSSWQKSWCEKNTNIIKKKVRKDFERLQVSEANKRENSRTRKENEETKIPGITEKKQKFGSLSERLEKEWQEINLRQLLKIVMENKLTDHEKLAKDTALEKDRLAFIDDKKQAIMERFNVIKANAADVRARILPAEELNDIRGEKISRTVKEILENSEPYEKIAQNLTDIIKKSAA